MKNYILETSCGEHFTKVADKAKEIAIDENFIVEFEFNEIKCLVNKDTNLAWLYRDYCNAHTMEWKTVGTDCVETYNPEIQAEINRRENVAEIKAKAQREIWDAKKLAKEKKFKEDVEGIEVELIKVDEYNEWLGKQNEDGYGLACFDYAMNWAKLMQKIFIEKNIENPDINTIISHAEKCSFDANIDDITGFMYGMSVSILVKHWKYGELLRKWHNKKYGDENSDGSTGSL